MDKHEPSKADQYLTDAIAKLARKYKNHADLIDALQTEQLEDSPRDDIEGLEDTEGRLATGTRSVLGAKKRTE